MNDDDQMFNFEIENLLRDLEEDDQEGLMTQDLREKQKQREIQFELQKNSIKKKPPKQQQQQHSIDQDSMKNLMLKNIQLQQQQQNRHQQEQSLDMRNMSDLLKELDLTERDLSSPSFRDIHQEKNGFVQQKQRQNQPQSHSSNSSQQQQQYDGSSFRKQDQKEQKQAESQHQSQKQQSQPSEGNHFVSGNYPKTNGFSAFEKENSMLGGLDNMSALHKEFQLHQMQHQLLQEHFMNNSIIGGNNSIIMGGNNNSIMVNPNMTLGQNGLPDTTAQFETIAENRSRAAAAAGQGNNNNNNYQLFGGTSNINNSIQQQQNPNQTNFDDIDNFLRHLDENDTVLYSSNLLNRTDVLS